MTDQACYVELYKLQTDITTFPLLEYQVFYCFINVRQSFESLQISVASFTSTRFDFRVGNISIIRTYNFTYKILEI